MSVYQQLAQYKPGPVPTNENLLPQYLNKELNNIAAILNAAQNSVIPQQSVAPAKVTNGMLLLADGTNWNPIGIGKGFVYWNSTDSSWHGLNAATEIKYLNGSGLTVEDLYINGVEANQITATSIQAGSITGTNIAAGTITGANIEAGSITASSLSVTELSAISANVGSLVVNKGGSISSGMTAFNVNAPGFWLGTDSSGNPQLAIVDTFGNYILFDSSSSSPISISSTGLINALSGNQTDNAGWSQTAVWGDITGIPTTVSGMGLTNAQTTLPTTTVKRGMFFSDNGGAIYAGPQYDTNVNFAAVDLPNTVFSTTSFVAWQPTIGFINPGQSINIHAQVSCVANITSGTATCDLEVEYSIDGGITWTAGNINAVQLVAATPIEDATMFAEVFALGVTPSGDVQIRALAKCSSGASANYENATLTAEFLPVSSFYTIAPLAASIPATASMSCSAAYPLTTCVATGTVTINSLTGVGPFSPSWSVTAGTGTIASGATAQTVTLTDTETTASPGATHTTTVKCVVTDSQSYPTTACTQSGGTATLTIGTHYIPAVAKITVSGVTPAAYNGTFTVTSITTTAVKYTVSGSPATATVQGTVNNVNVTTGNCVMTGTFTETWAPISGSVSSYSGNCTAARPAYNCTASGTATANPEGGNGHYTYSWTVTSGGGSIVSGATAQTVTVSYTQAGNCTSAVQGVQCAVNDTRSTGSQNLFGTINLQFRNSVPGCA